MSECQACWDKYPEDDLIQCQGCKKLFCSTCMDECSLCSAEMCYECMSEHKKVESQLVHDIAKGLGSIKCGYWYAANSVNREQEQVELEFLSSKYPDLTICIKLKDIQNCGVEQLVTHWPHKPEIAGSNPVPANGYEPAGVVIDESVATPAS